MKPSAKRVAALYLAGGVEKTDSGKWKATKGDKTQYFDDKDKAQAWAKGKGGDSKEGDPRGGGLIELERDFDLGVDARLPGGLVIRHLFAGDALLVQFECGLGFVGSAE